MVSANPSTQQQLLAELGQALHMTSSCPALGHCWSYHSLYLFIYQPFLAAAVRAQNLFLQQAHSLLAKSTAQSYVTAPMSQHSKEDTWDGNMLTLPLAIKACSRFWQLLQSSLSSSDQNFSEIILKPQLCNFLHNSSTSNFTLQQYL